MQGQIKLAVAAQALGSRVTRSVVLRPNFGNLAVFQAGSSYDFWVGRLAFFWPIFKGRLTETFLCWPFL